MKTLIAIAILWIVAYFVGPIGLWCMLAGGVIACLWMYIDDMAWDTRVVTQLFYLIVILGGLVALAVTVYWKVEHCKLIKYLKKRGLIE